MNLYKKFEDVYIDYNNDELTIGNSYFERRWDISPNGPISKKFANKLTEVVWEDYNPIVDWQLPDGSEPQNGLLFGINSEIVEEDGFTSSCLRVGVQWTFKDKNIMVRWDIKVYPDAPGMWTRLYVIGSMADVEVDMMGARCAYMPTMGNKFSAFGYYNDTQNRNKDQTEILRDKVVYPKEKVTWANAILNKMDDGGWMTVKESHKCVNQMGYETGGFYHEYNGITTTGWGLKPCDLRTWKVRGGWANWTIVWGRELSAEDALKAFDRARYPFDATRDTYIMANTWGSGRDRKPAYTESIIQEIDLAKELGIDLIQVDDGWQCYKDTNTWIPPVSWKTDDKRFPDGWKIVREYAKKQGIAMGLWSAWVIPSVELVANMKLGDFHSFKLDFAELDSYEKIECLMEKARHLVDASGNKARINWDVTENPPRVGYYFAREFGNIYLENRKEKNPQSVIYTPRLVLRDAWQLSKWLPLNKFQITYQNPTGVDPDFSDAAKYPHDYCFAITLMGSPIMFMELKRLTVEARKAIKPLIDAYVKVRGEILAGRVSPIGDKPNGRSFTGFQCEVDEKMGYITVFRELDESTGIANIKLHNIGSNKITLTNLLSGEESNTTVSQGGMIDFEIANAPGYLFFKYRCE